MAVTVIQVTHVCQFQCLEKKTVGATFCHFFIFFPDGCADFKKNQCRFIFANQQIAEMGSQPCNDVLSFKPIAQDFIQC